MLKRFAVLGIGLLLVSSTAFAGVVTVGNDRPVGIGVSAETALFGTGGLLTGKADEKQLGLDYFNPAGSNFSEFSLQFELAGNKGTNSLIMYSLLDPTKYLTIFDGPLSPVKNVGVTFTYNSDKGLWDILAADITNIMNPIFKGEASFESRSFGFALKNGSNVFFGDDTLNPNNAPQMLVFDGISGWENGYWFAFEDVAYASADKDFNDMVFYGQSIVPEPGSLLLLGSGLVGLIGLRRKIA